VAREEEEVAEEDLLSRQRVGESIKGGGGGGGEGEGGELPGRTKREKSFRKKERKRVGKKASEEEQGIHPASGVVINSGSEPRASGALATTVHCLSFSRAPPLK
jgi:hypothetical protein